MMLRYYDSHLHLQDPRCIDKARDWIEQSREVGVQRFVVNGTSPDDWPAVSQLANEFPQFVIPSFGMHPWQLTQGSTRWASDSWFVELSDYLHRHANAGIGECGLDRWMENPDIERQLQVFKMQLELAAAYDLPISIHVLKAWGLLLETLQSTALPPRGILLHSFGGSSEIAQQLVEFGAYFSFSGYFLHERKQSVRDAFTALPHDRILIETDAPDMLGPESSWVHAASAPLNHPANLIGVAEGLAEVLGMEVSQLSYTLAGNFARYFVD